MKFIDNRNINCSQGSLFSVHCLELLRSQQSSLKRLGNFRRAMSRNSRENTDVDPKQMSMKYVTCTKLECEAMKLIPLQLCAFGGHSHHAFTFWISEFFP